MSHSKLCTKFMNSEECMEGVNWQEVRIPVPWGHLAGKAWGKKNAHQEIPILGVHGWQDNCGTFDLIAPMIAEFYYFVTIDLPGHGLSSHIPSGFTYNTFDGILVLRRVIDFFKWKKLNFIGHSLGGGMGLLFAATFPNFVHKLISIDLIKLHSTDPRDLPSAVAMCYNQITYVEEKQKTAEPLYSYEEALEKLLLAHNKSLDENSGKIILNRGLKKNGDKYCFTRDFRLSRIHGPHRFTQEQLLAFAKSVKCYLMIIRAKASHVHEDSEIIDQFVETYRQTTAEFKYLEVEGSHHVHLIRPQEIGEIILNFLNN